MAETAIHSSKATVFKFTNGAWANADGGLSTLWLLHNPTSNTYRIVGRDDTSQQYNLNLGFVAELIYHKATETFLQLKFNDENYGLNFQSGDECSTVATLFAQIMATFQLPAPISTDDDAIGNAEVKRKSSKRLSQKTGKERRMSKRMSKAFVSIPEEAQGQQGPPEEEKESLRDKAAKEIWTSEVSYYKSLTQLSENWMAPLKKLMSNEDFNAIFSNIEVIRQFSQRLCQDLEKRWQNWSDTQKIGDIFVEMSNYLKMYKTYCENYDNALNKYQEVLKKNKVKEFLKNAEQQSGGFSLPFYLIMPVQRIPRYMLLLRELLSKTPETHVDYADLQKALTAVSAVAEEVNKGVGDAEKEKKKQEIMRRNYAGMESLMLPHRSVITEGELDVSSGPHKCNWAILFNDIIAFCNEGKNRAVLTHFSLDYSWVVDLSDVGPNCFEIQTPEYSAFITAKDKVTKDRWVEAIETAIKEWLTKKNLLKAEDPKVRIILYEYQDKSVYWGEWVASKPMGAGRFTSPNGSVFVGNFVKGVLHGTGTATFKTGEVYEGEWARDLPHGKGKLVVPGKYGKTYEGEWESGKKKGKGTLRWENGDVYEGEWDHDRFHGKGVLTKVDGSKYDGEWKDGKRHGRGIYISPIGEIYEGEWSEGMKHGTGKLTEPGGGIYEGQFVDDCKHGMGVYECALYRYEGQWANDKKHGKGTLTTKNGEVYVGEWSHDKRSGYGKQTYSDGSWYEGQWSDNKRNGKGTWVHPAGYKYEGQWKDDSKNGVGIWIEPDNTVYDGEWLADRREGKGKQVWPNGCSYDGQWKNNKRQGDGVFIWKDGSKYTGQWVADKRHGAGTMEMATGVYSGEWKDDKRDGLGLWRGKDGTIYKGEWKEDKKHGRGILTHSGGIESELFWKEGFLIKPGIKHFPPDLPDPVYF